MRKFTCLQGAEGCVILHAFTKEGYAVSSFLFVLTFLLFHVSTFLTCDFAAAHALPKQTNHYDCKAHLVDMVHEGSGGAQMQA